MKNVKKLFLEVVLAAGLVCCMGACSAVSASSSYQIYTTDNMMIDYLSGVGGDIQSATVQWGNSAISEADLADVGEIDGTGVSTTILLDNSFSITAENRVRMKEVCRQIIAERLPEETFTLATFDTELKMIAVDSDDYSSLLSQIDGIEFHDQDTYINDVLYKVITDIVSKEDYIYDSLIVLSDGSNDQQVGYTNEEVKRLAQEHGILINVVGSRYEKKISDLDSLFALARSTGGKTFQLEDTSDTAAIAKELKQQRPQKILWDEIPGQMMDGGRKTIQVVLTTGSGEVQLPQELVVPFGQVAVQEETAPPETEEQTEPVTEKITEAVPLTAVLETEETIIERQDPEHKISPMVMIGLIAAAAIVLILLIWLMLRKKKDRVNPEDILGRSTGGKGSSDTSDNIQNEDRTVLQKDQGNRDDGKTVSIFSDGSSNAERSFSLRLTDMNDSSSVFTAVCRTDILIGRKAECTISLAGDKGISRRHCIIRNDHGILKVTDCGSANGTFVNNIRVTGETNLSDGDILKLGDREFRIQII